MRNHRLALSGFRIMDHRDPILPGARGGLLAPGLILIGGSLSALSAGLVWARADAAALTPGVPAMFMNESALLRRGFDLRLGWLSVGWAVVICAVAASALLLWTGTNPPAAAVSRTQMTLGAAIVLLSLLHASAYPGPIAAALGGGLTAAGSWLAFRAGAAA